MRVMCLNFAESVLVFWSWLPCLTSVLCSATADRRMTGGCASGALWPCSQWNILSHTRRGCSIRPMSSMLHHPSEVRRKWKLCCVGGQEPGRHPGNAAEVHIDRMQKSDGSRIFLFLVDSDPEEFSYLWSSSIWNIFSAHTISLENTNELPVFIPYPSMHMLQFLYIGKEFSS
jgi:hypothetical protein